MVGHQPPRGRLSARALARAGVWSAHPARTRPGSGRWLPFGLALLAVLVVWFGVTASGAVEPIFLPRPATVVDRLVSQAESGLAWRYLRPTVLAALLGSGIALVVAIPLAVLITHSRLAGAVLEPFIALSQTIPLVAIAPLLVLWIGYGMLPIAVLCAIIAFFPMVTTTVVGFRSLDMRLVDHALLDGANARQRLWHLELPMVAPSMLAGIRGGVVLSMTGAIVGEFVMGGAGAGTLLTLTRDAADTAGVFAVVIWISLAALVLHGLVQALERAAVARLQSEQS